MRILKPPAFTDAYQLAVVTAFFICCDDKKFATTRYASAGLENVIRKKEQQRKQALSPTFLFIVGLLARVLTTSFFIRES